MSKQAHSITKYLCTHILHIHKNISYAECRKLTFISQKVKSNTNWNIKETEKSRVLLIVAQKGNVAIGDSCIVQVIWVRKLIPWNIIKSFFLWIEAWNLKRRDICSLMRNLNRIVNAYIQFQKRMAAYHK